MIQWFDDLHNRRDQPSFMITTEVNYANEQQDEAEESEPSIN